MSEKVHTFGKHGGLVGVVSQPDPPRDAPAVLLLNAGLVHRVGPYRMHVDLARRLAAAGYLVLRFDQSAIGDSEPRHERLCYEDRAVADVKDAMDFLQEKFKVERFIPMGLCSGAMNAHRAGMADERVRGAVLIDGYAYRTMGNLIRHYAPRLLSPIRVADALRRRVGGSRRLPGERPAVVSARDPVAPGDELPGGDATAIFEQEWPPRDLIARDLAVLARRKTSLLYVYTRGGNDQSGFNHVRQFAEMFPDPEVLRQVEVEYFADADHTFTLLAQRAALLERILRWMRRF